MIDRTEPEPPALTSDPYGADIYTEPPGEPDTLNNLGPLRPMAGVWQGVKGSDDHPVVEGSLHQEFDEHYELQPIDFQTNGPQIYYGLRYHTHILQADQLETFHDQIGYWLWEPAASMITFTLAIPRGQVLLAAGPADVDATEFELTAALGSDIHGILSNPFLYRAFRTTSYRMHVTVNDDGTWSYEEEGVLQIPGRDEPFHHVDRNTLHKIAEATPNPLVDLVQSETSLGPEGDTSLGIGSLRNERGSLQ
jgi:hypothetical protein